MGLGDCMDRKKWGREIEKEELGMTPRFYGQVTN